MTSAQERQIRASAVSREPSGNRAGTVPEWFPHGSRLSFQDSGSLQNSIKAAVTAPVRRVGAVTAEAQRLGVDHPNVGTEREQIVGDLVHVTLALRGVVVAVRPAQDLPVFDAEPAPRVGVRPAPRTRHGGHRGQLELAARRVRCRFSLDNDDRRGRQQQFAGHVQEPPRPRAAAFPPDVLLAPGHPFEDVHPFAIRSRAGVSRLDAGLVITEKAERPRVVEKLLAVQSVRRAATTAQLLAGRVDPGTVAAFAGQRARSVIFGALPLPAGWSGEPAPVDSHGIHPASAACLLPRGRLASHASSSRSDQRTAREPS